MQPDDFPPAEERKGLHCFAQFRDSFESLAAVAGGAVNYFVIEPSDFSGPVLVNELLLMMAKA